MPDPVPQTQNNGWIPISTATPSAPASAPDPNGWQPLNLAAKDPAPWVAPTVTPLEVAKGVGEGAVQSAVGLTELANKVPGSPTHLIPQTVLDKGKELSQPGSTGEQGGKMLEEGAEWAGGEEAFKSLAQLAKVAHYAPEVMKIIEDSPTASKTILDLIKRTGVKAVEGGVVGGTQGAVKASGEGESPAQGFEGGAAGGALASGAGEAVEGGVKDIAKRFNIGTSSMEDVQKALQFKKTDHTARRDAELALPTIGQKFRTDGKPEDMADAYKKINEAKNEHWNSKVAGPTAARANDIPADATGKPQDQGKVRDAVLDRITPVMKEHFPKRAEVLKDFADRWGGTPKTIGQINDEITQFNAELGAKGYWESTPEKRAELERTDPEIAGYVAAGDELRDIMFTHLKATGVPNIDEDRKLYGALAHMGGEVRSRINVDGRQPGTSGKEFLGVLAGAAKGGPVGAAMAAGTLAEKAASNRTSLLAKAAEKSLPDTSTQKAVKAVRSTGVKAGKITADVVGEDAARDAWIKFRGGDGKDYEHHPDESMEDIQKADPGAAYPEAQ